MGVAERDERDKRKNGVLRRCWRSTPFFLLDLINQISQIFTQVQEIMVPRQKITTIEIFSFFVVFGYYF